MFSFNHCRKDNALAKSVLSTYENRRAEMLKMPALAVVNHKRGTVHTYTESDHSQETITTWLKGVQEGEITQTSKMASYSSMVILTLPRKSKTIFSIYLYDNMIRNLFKNI